MAKFNIKKLLKGEDIYAFGEGEFSYACTKCVGIKVKKKSPLHEEMKKDLKFANWNESYTKEKVKEKLLDIFSTNHEEQKIDITSILIDFKDYIRRIVFCDDCLKQINNKYIEVMNNWGNIKCYSTPNERTPFYFISEDFEIVIMPLRNSLPEEEINKLSTVTNRGE